MRFVNSMISLMLPMFVTVPVAAYASDGASWNCRNVEFEISCDDGKCNASDDHTPMDVHVSSSEISWCAYSGCWTGVPSAALTSGSFASFYGFVQREGSTMADGVDVAVTIDRTTNGAAIMAAGIFASPATCEPG